MKFAFAAILGAFVLAGCQEKLTLEEAQAKCAKEGGFLVIIYTQQITTSGAGPQIASPGNCVASSKFDIASPAPNPPAPAPANESKLEPD